MKKLFPLILASFLMFASRAYPQQNKFDLENIRPEIKSYMEMLNGYTKNMNIDSAELSSYAKYNAIENHIRGRIWDMTRWKILRDFIGPRMRVLSADAVQYNYLLYMDNKKIDSLLKAGGDSNSFSNLIFERRILDGKLMRYFPYEKIALFSTPYFLKATITKIDTERISPDDNRVILTKVNLTGKIEDYIRTDNNFMRGDTITFFYVAQWYNRYLDIKEGDEIFAGLDVQVDNEKEIYIRIRSLKPNNAVFKIENNILHDIGNEYGFGEYVNWDEFKTKYAELVTPPGF